jgi:hypothetical protein
MSHNIDNTLSNNKWLKYDPEHCVLICRECQYAIQKSAVESHLLKHKIYRGERQRLLSSISQCALLETEDVQSPSAGISPIEGLQVIPGYKCNAPRCESLFGSLKRMKRHWSEVHETVNPPENFSRPASIQTFFKGTKLKYFEVAVTRADPVRSFVHDTPWRSQGFKHLELDLKVLKYFHHYSNETAPSLPKQKSCSANHWGANVVTRALDLPWVMFGLLSLSANHMAFLSGEMSLQKEHRDMSLAYYANFLAGWEHASTNTNLGTSENIEGAQVGAQLVCLLRCYHWLPQIQAIETERNFFALKPFSLHLLMRTIKGCVDCSFALRLELSPDTDNNLDIEAPASQDSDSSINEKRPSILVDHLRRLPFRLAEVFGRPDHLADVVATLTAIQALLQCSLLSYSSDDKDTVWLGMESWLHRLSDHFWELVVQNSPAALVVLAHWSVLLNRAGSYCWYLKDLGTKAIRQITQDLPQDPALHGLIEGLICI